MFRDETKDAVRELVRGMGATHYVTFNPLIPGLRIDQPYELGLTLAKRLKDRADLNDKAMVLFVEQCPQGFFHYHGFIACETEEQRLFVTNQAKDIMEEAMRNQAVRKYARHEGARPPRCSADIKPLEGRAIEAALLYATKEWNIQDKAGTFIYV